MHHSGGLSEIEPSLYEEARAHIEKLKADYYSLQNPLESRMGSGPQHIASIRGDELAN